jgi:Right handed beta helix region
MKDFKMTKQFDHHHNNNRIKTLWLFLLMHVVASHVHAVALIFDNHDSRSISSTSTIITTTATVTVKHMDNGQNEEKHVQEKEIVVDDTFDNYKKELDCAMRMLFYNMSRNAVPWRIDMSDVFNSLELDRYCSDLVEGSDKHGYVDRMVIDPDPTTFTMKKSLMSTSSNSTSIGRHRQRRRRRMTGTIEQQLQQRTSNDMSYSTDRRIFYVCPRTGVDDDANIDGIGSRSHPFATIERALDATRRHQHQQYHLSQTRNNTVTTIRQRKKRQTIMLVPGIHFLKNTIVLKPVDSHLEIRSSDDLLEDSDGKAWISGGILISSKNTTWKKMENTTNDNKNNIWIADLTALNISSITGLFTVGTTTHHERMTLARYPNANVEDWDQPNRYMPHNSVHEWLFPPFGDVPTFEYIDLSRPDNPTGHIKNDSTMEDYNAFGTGQGGSCATVWGPSPSYWCSNISAGGWAEVDKIAALAGRMNIPRGMTLSSSTSKRSSPSSSSSAEEATAEQAADAFVERAKRWSNPQGAIVHVSHTQGWAWHMFEVSHLDDSNLQNRNEVTIHFKEGGGSQGGRNWQCKDEEGHLSDCDGDDKKLAGGDWYIEGILEELDEPGEFYFDTTTKLLFFIPKQNCVADDTREGGSHDNDSEKKHQSECIPDLVATNLQTLIKIEGTMDNPVKDVKIRGLGFRDAAKTYMEQWSAPSGGDWALHRGGAIHLEGTHRVEITDSHFHRLDGNGIMLGGYSHGTHVARCDFAWMGNGAIATWGDTVNDGYDATLPTQPRKSIIEHNIMSNLGLYQKQSSAWGQNKACLNVVRNNVMFDLPRAAINFNDGLGGGNVIEGNVIFNSCRESGDHGPINRYVEADFGGQHNDCCLSVF